MRVITADQVHAALSWPTVLLALERAYAGAFTMPPRNVMRLSAEEGNHEAFALLPAWNEEVIAVKAFTYFPQNEPPLASLSSQILMFERQHGQPLALVDGTSVTYWRTAGVSALAAHYLSRGDSATLLLIGTGKLASYLVRAHASVRPLRRTLLWGRNAARSQVLIERLQSESPEIQFSLATSIESACQQADVIVCATGSPDILVRGSWLRPGTHLDCLGNHHADHRECDTEAILRSRVYVDTFANCFKEAGEILLPIQEGRFAKESVVGELADLAARRVQGRLTKDEITVFKSVGAALGDLATAQLVSEQMERLDDDALRLECAKLDPPGGGGQCVVE